MPEPTPAFWYKLGPLDCPLGTGIQHSMSNIRSCGSLQSGNDALLRAKQEPIDDGQGIQKRLAMLHEKKQVGSPSHVFHWWSTHACMHIFNLLLPRAAPLTYDIYNAGHGGWVGSLDQRWGDGDRSTCRCFLMWQLQAIAYDGYTHMPIHVCMMHAHLHNMHVYMNPYFLWSCENICTNHMHTSA